MNNTYLKIFFPLALIYLFLLVIFNSQAALLFLTLIFFFGLIILIASKIKNSLYLGILILGSIAHVIGAPLFLLNKDSYNYSGWNAVKDFDFSSAYFFNVYTLVIISLFFLTLFVYLFELIFRKVRPNKSEKIISLNDSHSSSQNRFKWSIVLVIMSLIGIALAVFMYIKNIAILGIESERLPFKLVGILFYFRGYGLPLLLFIVYRKSLQTNFIAIFIVIVALIIGGLSASRGVTFIYMFPVLVMIISRKFSLKNISIGFLLILIGYMSTSLIRDILYSNTSMSLFDLPYLLLSTESSFKSDDGFIISFLNIISTISNRLYGAQDSVLAYQYTLDDPWNAFANFIISGSLVEDLAGELYGLIFLPGMGYGVGLGLIGVLVMLGRANIFLLFVAIIFFALLIVITNKVITNYFLNSRTKELPQIYYLILFITAFNFLQATLSYIYMIILIFLLITFFKKILPSLNRISNF